MAKTSSITKTNKTKKTKKDDISKGKKRKISHSVQKIKSNERKYTIILVVFFMLLFCIIGYFTLSIHTNNIWNNLNVSIKDSFSNSSSGQLVTLTEKNAISDSDGLASDIIAFTIENSSKVKLKYRVMFVQDEINKRLCECKNNIPYNYIKYSIDGMNVAALNKDLVITTGVLNGESSRVIETRLWVDNTFSNNEDSHYHGHFVLEEME